MKTKEEIKQCVSNLNIVGCEVKVLYQNNTTYLEISGDNYCVGTEKQILCILYAISRAVCNSTKSINALDEE